VLRTDWAPNPFVSRANQYDTRYIVVTLTRVTNERVA